MRWEQGRRSDNVEDQRGRSALGGRGLKIGGGLSLVVVVVGLIMGEDLTPLLRALSGGEITGTGGATPAAQPRSAEENKLAEFVSVVLADTEDTWTAQFKQMNRSYVKPKLVLFTDAVNSACGYNSAAVGPFYCPGDRKVYIDLSFYSELQRRFGAPGDFAQAYVIAHEIGHHVQNLLGLGGRGHGTSRNQQAVLQELQADCLAGVWGHHAQAQRQMLEAGDVEEAIGAAIAIGDDRLQKQAGRAITPETWTHGSSKQRARWFDIGMKQGTLQACDTYSAANP